MRNFSWFPYNMISLSFLKGVKGQAIKFNYLNCLHMWTLYLLHNPDYPDLFFRHWMNSTNCVKFHKMVVLKAKPAKQACIWFYLTGQDYILDFPTKRIEGYERPLKKLIWLVSYNAKFNQNRAWRRPHLHSICFIKNSL